MPHMGSSDIDPRKSSAYFSSPFTMDSCGTFLIALHDLLYLELPQPTFMNTFNKIKLRLNMHKLKAKHAQLAFWEKYFAGQS
jgi:hypothetical protein